MNFKFILFLSMKDMMRLSHSWSTTKDLRMSCRVMNILSLEEVPLFALVFSLLWNTECYGKCVLLSMRVAEGGCSQAMRLTSGKFIFGWGYTKNSHHHQPIVPSSLSSLGLNEHGACTWLGSPGKQRTVILIIYSDKERYKLHLLRSSKT